MDIDPLADTVPPRHAIESDDEDEYNPLSSVSEPQLVSQLGVEMVGNHQTGQKLVIAAGDAGETWARGAGLGEQIAFIRVGSVQVGSCFSPEWTKANVVVSETATRIPAWARYKYAKTIIGSLRPSTVIILDSYPVPGYINDTSGPITAEPPIRYLTNAKADLDSHILPFTPPNLIHSTSASFLTLPEAPPSTLLLLPHPRISRLPPPTLGPPTPAPEDSVTWPPATAVRLHNALLRLLGQHSAVEWEHAHAPGSTIRALRRAAEKRSQIGDGVMYI